MNNFLIPGDYASFELVSKDYCTVFISFQMPTCHLCGIVLPLEILFQVELNKLACLLQSTGKLCVLGIFYVCSSYCPLGAFKVMNQAPKIARLTPNHGFKKKWKFLLFIHYLMDNKFWCWFQYPFFRHFSIRLRARNDVFVFNSEKLRHWCNLLISAAGL